MKGPAQAPPSGLSDWLAGYAGMRAPARSAPWRALAVVLMLCGITMMLWSLPVPALIGRPGLYAALAGVGLLGRYLRLSRALALVALALLLPVFAGAAWLNAWIGHEALLPLGAAVAASGVAAAIMLARTYGQGVVAAVAEDAWLGPAWLVERAATRLGFRL